MKATAHKSLIFTIIGLLIVALTEYTYADTSDLIRETLKEIDHVIPFSEDAVAFLELTACAETLNGKYLGNQWSVDRGIFQINIKTEMWIETGYAPMKGWSKFLESYKTGPNPLHNNLKYQIVLARIILWTIPEKLNDRNDILGMSVYWKKHWNTHLGKGTVEGAFEKYIEHRNF